MIDENKIYDTIQPSRVSQDWHHLNCYGCGPNNQKGLHYSFPFDEERGEVLFKTTIQDEHEGAPGYVHGGIIAAILDEAQGVLCFHLGHFVMTDTLKIHYKKACPLREELEVRAHITSVRRRRLYTNAMIKLVKTGDILATSKARWYDLPERMVSKMFHYSVETKQRILIQLSENKKRGKLIRKKIREFEDN